MLLLLWQHADGFAKDWDGWLRKVTLQVRAAVDLAKGLPAAKKDRLDGILSHDVVRAPCAPGPALLRARACGAPCSAARRRAPSSRSWPAARTAATTPP